MFEKHTKPIVKLAKRIRTEQYFSLSFNTSDSLPNNIDELLTTFYNARNEIKGLAQKSASQIKAQLLSYESFKKTSRDLGARLESLKSSNHLKNKYSEEITSELNSFAAVDDPLYRLFNFFIRTADEFEQYKAEQEARKEEIRIRKAEIEQSLQKLKNELNDNDEEIKKIQTHIESLTNEQNKAENRELDQQIRVIEQIFNELYREATSRDHLLSKLLSDAKSFLYIGLMLSCVALACAFIPMILGGLTAILVGIISFIMLCSVSSSGDILRLCFDLGQEVYAIASVLMPFIIIASASTAALAFAVSGICVIGAALVNYSKDEYFENTLRTGLAQHLLKENATSGTSVVHNSIFNTSRSHTLTTTDNYSGDLTLSNPF